MRLKRLQMHVTNVIFDGTGIQKEDFLIEKQLLFHWFPHTKLYLIWSFSKKF